jgi:glycosyltransferase involved in cell wall biosynthesis
MKHTILFMAQLPPPVHGAALRNKSLLESELLNNEFNVISLPLKFIDDMKDMGKFSFRKIFLMARHAFRMIGIFTSRKVDLVYFTMSPSGFAFYRDIFFIALIKLFGKKRLLHFRMKGIQATGKKRIGNKLVKYAFKGSDIVCLSHHHMMDMEGFTNRPPYIVPNGIKVEKEFLPLADEYRFDANAPAKLLFLSNLTRTKGIPELIEAVAMLKTKGYRMQVDIVGDEWYMSFNEAKELISKAGVEDIVTLVGPKTGRDKFRFIANADLFVFPTWFELFPGVILEAMQFGKPIVSTFEGSIPDIVENGKDGILVEPKNAVQLAEAIAYMLDHPTVRLEMAANARKKFFEDFTLEAFERKMHAVFEDVLSKN